MAKSKKITPSILRRQIQAQETILEQMNQNLEHRDQRIQELGALIGGEVVMNLQKAQDKADELQRAVKELECENDRLRGVIAAYRKGHDKSNLAQLEKERNYLLQKLDLTEHEWDCQKGRLI